MRAEKIGKTIRKRVPKEPRGKKVTGKCKTVPDGHFEASRTFREPMTQEDSNKAEEFIRRYREWSWNKAQWDAFIMGGAGHVFPVPSRPGSPPSQPRIVNTACIKAAQEGYANIKRSLKELLETKFSCTDEGCTGQARCQRKFKYKKTSPGRGISYVARETVCIVTAVGTCECQ
ncbi:MAG: hypothetical protein ABGX83_08580 [Nitrospira sp.]|nr:hypothetical protein [Candidatus Manganitrophaceae bacterium]